MGTGQTLLTLAALMMMGMILLNNNRAMVGTGSQLDDHRYRLEALSILTSHIEQLSQYYFDEASTDTLNSKQVTDFATLPNLGMDANDGGLVDDIDDLNGLTVPDTGRSGVVYNINYIVDYVSPNPNGFIHQTGQRYHKRVRISINDTFNPPFITRLRNGTTVRDTIRLETVMSYWFYN